MEPAKLSRQSLGAQGEALARQHLLSLGYRIEACNVRTRQGELDIVARNGESYIFVEVKARRSYSHGLPEEAITPRKWRTLLALAQSYLQLVQSERADWRIDCIAIDLGPRGELRELRHYPAISLG